MRQHIRYPVNVAVEISFPGVKDARPQKARDVSFGGLCLVMDECPGVGAKVVIGIPSIQPPFNARFEVLWCNRIGERFEVGMRLLEDEDPFLFRMVEQVCHIEQYRKQVFERNGRGLTKGQAANEWIARFSKGFPGDDAEDATLRRYIRHPVDVPVETTLLSSQKVFYNRLEDISLGGLCFHLSVQVDVGVQLKIRLLYSRMEHEFPGRVVWCRPGVEGAEVGVALDQEVLEEWSSVLERIQEQGA